MKKYELDLTNSKIINGKTVYRIVALKDIIVDKEEIIKGCNVTNKEVVVKTGDKGGYVENENNLSHKGNCWIYDEAVVFDNAEVIDDVVIKDNAKIYDRAIIKGSSKITGNAQVYGNAIIDNSAHIFGNARVIYGGNVYGDAKVYDNALIMDYARVFGNAIICENAIISETQLISCGIWKKYKK